MKKLLILAVIISILFINITSAASDERIENGSMSITIKDDIVTIKLRDQNGAYKKLSFDKKDYNDIDLIKRELFPNEESNLCIRDELIIEGDNITIDGKIFTPDEIKKVHFYSELDQGVSLRTKLPYYNRCEVSCNKDIRIDSDSDSDLFGFGNLVVEAGETIYGDVVALTGDVEIYGEVMGDVVAVFGDVIMHDGSYATGDVVTPFGQVIKRGTIKIGGDTMPREHLRVMGRESDIDLDFTARYNRVEGLTLLNGIYYEDYYDELPEFHFNYGYAFALKKWDLNGGFRQEFGRDYAFYFGADLYQGAATADEWMFTTHENTLAGLIFKEDYHDFFYRKGLNIYAGQKLAGDVHFQIDYAAEDYSTLAKNTNYAIFGNKKDFRENYSTIENQYLLNSIEGERRTLTFSFGWDNRDSEDWPRRGQLVDLKWESAGDDGYIGGLRGEKSFDRVSVTFANYLPINRKQHIGLVLRGGYSDDDLPLDKHFFLGGPGSLRGYNYKEFSGNRFVLANLDYYFEFSNDFAIAVFGDAGKTAYSESSFEDSDYKSDLGLGIMFLDVFRLDIAQRLDEADDGPVVMARSMIHF